MSCIYVAQMPEDHLCPLEQSQKCQLTKKMLGNKAKPS